MDDDLAGRVRPLEPDGNEPAVGSGQVASGSPMGSGRPPMWVAVGAALVVGLFVGWLIGASGSGNEPEIQEASATTVPSVVNDVGTATGSTISEQPAAGSVVEGSITLLPDAGWLRLPIGLAMSPADSDSQEVYVIEDAGSIRQQGDLPLIREFVLYPFLWLDDSMLYLAGGNAYLLDSTLDDSPMDLGRANQVVPGATPDRAWLIGGNGGLDGWIAGVDTSTGQVGARIDMAPDIQMPLGGVANGLLVRPTDVGSHGEIAYWTPELGVQAFDIEGAKPAGFGGLVASSGDVAVISSWFPEVRVVDVASRDVLTTFAFDPGDGLWAKACLSPQERFVALIGSNGRGVVVSTEDGSVIQEFEVGQTRGAINAIGWTTPDQLLRIVDGPEGRRLVALDVFTGSERDIAALDPTADWLLATPGSTC